MDDGLDHLVDGPQDDGWQDYMVDPTASWYHPEHCREPDHHEWLHAKLIRTEKRETGAYQAMDVSNRTGAKALALLRELYQCGERTGDVFPSELAARVRSFLNAADWHQALKNFMDGNE